MAVDFDRKVIVVFGGQGMAAAPSFLSDTWEWTETGWTQTSAQTRPPAMIGATMTYDSLRRKIVLFGGNASPTATAALQSKTWEYDTGTHRWTELTQISTSPPGRYLHAEAWDSVANRVVILGGTAEGSVAAACSNDMWAFDGSNWHLVASSGAPQVYNQKMIFDSFRSQRVLWGGYCGMAGNTQYNHIPHVLDGGLWEPRGLTPGPSWPESVQAGSFAYVPVRRDAIYHGGFSDSGGGVPTTHRWNGTTWLSTTPIGPGPGRRSYATLVWAPWLNRLVLFGGADGDTNSFVTKNETWLYGGP